MVAGKGLLVGLFAFAAWGQTSDKVFYFAHLESPQAMQEVTNMVRMIGDIRDVSLDVAKRSLTVKGTADQIAAASWLTAELDKPGSATGTRDYPFNDARAPLAQVVYLSRVDNPQDLQQIVNAVRSITDIQRCSPMYQQKAIVMRGSPEQVKAADWLLSVLDQPAGAPPEGAAGHEYRLDAAAWGARSGLVVRVAGLSHIDTPQALQEITNVTRSMADIQRCFPVYGRGVLVLRGDDDQMALADWLLKQLDGPAGQGTKEFKVGGTGNQSQMAQVAYVSAGTRESLQETVNAIRTETKMPRVFPLLAQGAVVMRGTADQLARAQQMIQSSKDK
jgi:type II secretory pathway component GspD/PulD (secretin)